MRSLFLSLLSVALIVPLAAQAAGNAERGRSVAETWCQPCHAGGNRGPTSDAAPSFGWIVDNRTPAAITGFLARPHGLMPDIQLSRGQIEDVVAYIESLKGK